LADYDVIVVGAGPNGLVAGAILAKAGLRTINFEKQRYVGGMSGTVEFFKGFRTNVAAQVLMSSSGTITQELEMEKRGLEVIKAPTSGCVVGEPGQVPYIYYNDRDRLLDHVRKDHGEDAYRGYTALMEDCLVFAKAVGRGRFRPPKSLAAIIDEMPNLEEKDLMRRWIFGSCMDFIRQHFPEPEKHKSLQGYFAAQAVDGTGLGPYCPGTAFSLGMHMSPPAVGLDYNLLKGGMGRFSEAVQATLEEHGGEVRLKSPVSRILVEGGKAVGVELRGGEKVSAHMVLSSVDAYGTFIRLMGEDALPSNFVAMVKRIKYGSLYILIHVTLREPPQYIGELAFANENNIGWLVNYIPSPEFLERCWDDCKWGRVPEQPYSSLFVPSILDPSLAPPGYHIGMFWSQYFPAVPPGGQHERMKEEMAQKVINQMCQFAPNLKDAIMDRVIFTPLQWEGMFGATAGDYSGGLMLPEQWFDFRPVVGWSYYRTPVKGLYLCGQGCHPGPTVNGVPGYNCAGEVLKDWKKG
jgi:phytoene dehydrogenase-like protein